jgi:hypothetical protein
MDICTQVSYTETMNYSALEAMSMGIPTVGCETIPFTTQVPMDNQVGYCEVLHKVLDRYEDYSKNAYNKAKELSQQNQEKYKKNIDKIMEAHNGQRI